jgi:hypothetical protein
MSRSGSLGAMPAGAVRRVRRLTSVVIAYVVLAAQAAGALFVGKDRARR